MEDQQFGKYTVVRRLGSGGMAEVFLCRLHGIGGFEKEVVVKRIRADIANDAEFVAMFFDEARLAANLTHQNVIQLFEVDQLEGVPYIAMEYVKGPTLAGMLQTLRRHGGTAEYGHLSRIFAGVCAGLDHAHKAEDVIGRPLKIVHRDISPQNIIVSMDGTPKIFDFGVAKARGSLAMTGTDRIKGKFAYMAPEQMRAQPVDYRADVYAIGVCLYEATVGQRPFVGGTEAELFAARLDGKFRRPSDVVANFPAELEEAILAAMWPEPDGRPTALELKDRLLAFAAGNEAVSHTSDVATWLHELFPDATTDAYEAYSSRPSAPPSSTLIPRSTKTPAVNAVELGRGRRIAWRGAVLAIVATAAAGVAGFVVRDQQRATNPTADNDRVAHVDDAARRPAAATASRYVASPSPERAIKTLLDAAEHSLDEQHADLAADYLKEASALTTEDKTLATRQRELLDRTKRVQLLRDAQDARSLNKPADARDLANQLLQLNPDDAEAKKLVAWAASQLDATTKRPVVTPQRTPLRTAVKTNVAARPAKPAPPVIASGSNTVVTKMAATPGPAVAESGSATPASGSAAPKPSSPAVAPAASPPVVSATTPSPAAAAQAKTVGSLDATSSTRISIDGPLVPADVERAIDRISGSFRGCYKAAAAKQQATPKLKLTIQFEIDEQGAASDVVIVRGDSLGVGGCVTKAISMARTQTHPDVGTVKVTAVVTFTPIKN